MLRSKLSLEYKKIFVDAHMFDHGFEGTASFIQGLYLALLEKYPGQYRIYLGCANPEQVLKSFEGNSAIETVKYQTENRYLRLLFEIPRLIQQIKPDIAHFQYFTPFVKNCKWHVTIHDVLFNDFPQYFPHGYARIRNILFPLSARRAELLSTVSGYSRERLAHWYGCEASKLTVIPNGTSQMDVRNLSPQTASVKTVLSNPGGFLLCVSRFEPRKNQANLLRAYLNGQYWKNGISLIFVGARTLRVPEFNQVWAEVPREAKACIQFLYGLPYADMQILNAHAIASIYPSFAEGFGMPPLESAVHGTPSLCAKTTAMAEFDFFGPMFFDPSDPEELRRAIDNVLENPEVARLHAETAMHVVRNRYSWSNSADILHQAMSKLINVPVSALVERVSTKTTE